MIAIGPFGLVLGGLGVASGIASLFGGKGERKRARGFEREALETGRRAGRRGERFLGQGGFADQARNRFFQAQDIGNIIPQVGRQIGQATQAFTRQALPGFEESLRGSLGNVIGGLGRRGGLVDTTVGQATRGFQNRVADVVAQNVSLPFDIASRRAQLAQRQFGLESQFGRMDEETFMSLLGQLSDVEERRGASKRQGLAGLGGLLGRGALFL